MFGVKSKNKVSFYDLININEADEHLDLFTNMLKAFKEYYEFRTYYNKNTNNAFSLI